MNFRLPAAALLITGASAAQAITSLSSPLTETSQGTVLPARTSNLNTFVDLAQFNPSLGTLLSVSLELGGTLDSIVKLENKSAAPTTLTANVSTSFGVGLPTTGTVSSVATLSTSFAAKAYDGVADFAGTSGTTLTGLHATASATRTFSQPADLALFTGTGTLHLPFTAVVTSSFSGTTLRRTQLLTDVGGYARITYTYDKPALVLQPTLVPEPGTWALMLAGVGMVGMLASRRRAG